MPAFFAHRLFAPVISGIAIAAVCALLWQTFRIEGFLWWDGFKDQVRTLTAERDQHWRDLGQCRANVTTLEGSLARQNEAVAEMEAEAMRRAAEAEAAAAQARVANLRANRTAAQLLALKPVGDECTAALNLLREPIQ